MASERNPGQSFSGFPLAVHNFKGHSQNLRTLTFYIKHILIYFNIIILI